MEKNNDVNQGSNPILSTVDVLEDIDSNFDKLRSVICTPANSNEHPALSEETTTNNTNDTAMQEFFTQHFVSEERDFDGHETTDASSTSWASPSTCGSPQQMDTGHVNDLNANTPTCSLEPESANPVQVSYGCITCNSTTRFCRCETPASPYDHFEDMEPFVSIHRRERIDFDRSGVDTGSINGRGAWGRCHSYTVGDDDFMCGGFLAGECSGRTAEVHLDDEDSNVGDEDNMVDDMYSNVDCVNNNDDGMDRNVDGVGNSNDGVGNNVDGVDSNVDGVENNVDSVDSNVDGVDSNVDGVDSNVDGVDSNVDGVVSDVDGVNSNVDGVDSNVDGVDSDVDGMNNNVNGMDSNVDGMYSTVEGLNNNIDCDDSDVDDNENKDGFIHPEHNQQPWRSDNSHPETNNYVELNESIRPDASVISINMPEVCSLCKIPAPCQCSMDTGESMQYMDPSVEQLTLLEEDKENRPLNDFEGFRPVAVCIFEPFPREYRSDNTDDENVDECQVGSVIDDHQPLPIVFHQRDATDAEFTLDIMATRSTKQIHTNSVEDVSQTFHTNSLEQVDDEGCVIDSDENRTTCSLQPMDGDGVNDTYEIMSCSSEYVISGSGTYMPIYSVDHSTSGSVTDTYMPTCSVHQVTSGSAIDTYSNMPTSSTKQEPLHVNDVSFICNICNNLLPSCQCPVPLSPVDGQQEISPVPTANGTKRARVKSNQSISTTDSTMTKRFYKDSDEDSNDLLSAVDFLEDIDTIFEKLREKLVAKDGSSIRLAGTHRAKHGEEGSHVYEGFNDYLSGYTKDYCIESHGSNGSTFSSAECVSTERFSMECQSMECQSMECQSPMSQSKWSQSVESRSTNSQSIWSQPTESQSTESQSTESQSQESQPAKQTKGQRDQQVQTDDITLSDIIKSTCSFAQHETSRPNYTSTCTICEPNRSLFKYPKLNFTAQENISVRNVHKDLANKYTVPAHHQRVHKPVTCTLCNQTFADQSALDKHIPFHGIAVVPLSCSVCSRIFKRPNQLKRHELEHTKRYSYFCKFCSAVFRKRNYLKKHEYRHTGTKSFICDQCNARFIHKYYLTRHLARHTGLLAFGCKHCGKCFSRRSSLKRHKLTHKQKQDMC